MVNRLITEVDLTSVCIHLDTFRLNIEEQRLCDAIVLAGSDLVYVDASESDPGKTGLGRVHWSELVRALH